MIDIVLVAGSHVTVISVGLTDHEYEKVSPSGSVNKSTLDVTLVVRPLTIEKSG